MSPVEASDDLFGAWLTFLCLASLAVSLIAFAVRGLGKYVGPRRGAPVSQRAPVSSRAPASQRAPESSRAPVSQRAPVSSRAPASQRGPAPVSSRAPASQRGTAPVSSRAPASQRDVAPASQGAPVSEGSTARVRRRVILLHAVTPGQTPHEYNVGDDAGTRGASLVSVA